MPENRAKFQVTIQLGRFSRLDDIARAAVHFASDDAEFITGVAFEIDGGGAFRGCVKVYIWLDFSTLGR